MNIVLKDQTDSDVMFTHVRTAPGMLEFQSRGDSLMDVKRLTLSLNENANTNRVRFKLSIPTIGTDAANKPVVTYTQVVSGDFTVVKFSSEDDRALLKALTSSLVSSATVSDLVVNGAFPV